MQTLVIPRKPYDAVESSFIREEIRSGDFEDEAYRRYVNELVGFEWYVRDWEGRGAISSFGVTVSVWRHAAMWPDAFDAVMTDLGEPTIDERTWGWRGTEDADERRRRARRHHREWRAVQNGDQGTSTTHADRDGVGDSSFAPFRFPKRPYDTVQSPYIKELIREGSFDDLEHRRHVNELVYIEWYEATGQPNGPSLGAPITNFKLAARHPDEYDIIRRELDARTRADMQPKGELGVSECDVDERLREAKAAWQRVQEAPR